MSYGYTSRIDKLNRTANSSSLGVKLGRLCIKRDVPVSEIASLLGVSRQTVYNWFVGTHEPSTEVSPLIEELIAEYN